MIQPLAPNSPFVLLDDASMAGAGKARLYRDPAAIVEARTFAQIAPALARVHAHGAAGGHVAGYLAYEAGLAFELRLRGRLREGPLLWFGLFDDVEHLDAADVLALLPDPGGAFVGAARPLTTAADYAAKLARVKEYIAAGDIYQANLTFAAEVPVAGHPLALYARLRGAARAGWGGIVHTGARWLLSFSPELFFTLADGHLTARPMKGTATRHPDDDPAAAVARLIADPKERAENLMIVDLLRNDLSRIARPGSVAVPHLFDVETYPTVHQMTSTITAELAEDRGPIDALVKLFPCGSITGAPKIRAMELIDEIEQGPRGPYCGAIGFIGPNGDAAFNVAIRTLEMEEGDAHARIGLGSGVVADSEAGAEWRECLAKGAFLDRPGPDLIETMRFDAREGLLDLERHLARLKASAEALGYPFDRHGGRNELQAATFRLREDRKVRLMLGRSGSIAIEVRPIPPAPEQEPVDVALIPLPVSPHDYRLRHKTNDRRFYDAARRAAGTFEIAFVDPEGFLTEGSFTSLFVERDGVLLTPPLARPLLPGVLRARLIEEGKAREADLRPADLAGGFLIGNALRGLIPARLVAAG